MKGRTKEQKVDQTLRVIPLLGRTLVVDSSRKERGRRLITLHDQPRANSRINDNYCVTRLQARLLAGSNTPVRTLDNLNLNLNVVSVHTAPGHSQKKEISSGSAGCLYKKRKLKYVKGVSCVTQLSCVKPVTNVQHAAENPPVGARLQNYWETWLSLGAGPICSSNPEGGFNPPLLDPTKTYKVTDGHKLLCQSQQQQLPVRGIASAYRQKRSGTGTQSEISRVFQAAFLGPKAKQQMETHIGPQLVKSLPQDGEIQNGDTGNHQDIPPTGRVDHLHRFQGCVFPCTHTGTVQELCEISCRGSNIPIQSTAIRSVHSKTDGHQRGYKSPPVPLFEASVVIYYVYYIPTVIKGIYLNYLK